MIEDSVLDDDYIQHDAVGNSVELEMGFLRIGIKKTANATKLGRGEVLRIQQYFRGSGYHFSV